MARVSAICAAISVAATGLRLREDSIGRISMGDSLRDDWSVGHEGMRA